MTEAQLTQVYSFRSMLTHNRIYGHGAAMKLVAVLDQDESRVVHWIFAEMEAELKAQAAITLADRPAVDAVPVEKVATEEAKAPAEYAAAV